MEQSIREKRIRDLTKLYYSRQDVQKAIFEFCKNREICPRYFEEFGKRPDTFEYPRDIFELVKKGATSFNCSEEIWKEPMRIVTGMNEEQANALRTGWDLVIDIDSKYLDYSKIYAGIIINFLKFSGVKNIGIKFSGSKGFHIIIPWKSFPKEVNGIKTSDMFPEWPRIIMRYLTQQTEKQLIEEISKLAKPNRYVKDFKAPKEVMPDLVLVSPRHLFRTPYSLHEKTALASVVINPEKILEFDMNDAEPLKAEVKNFIPESKEGEARELLIQAMDWYKEKNPEKEKEEKIKGEFKPVKILNLSEANFPPCITKILAGLSDGRKRALFILINLFRSLGIDRDEVEKRIFSWNEKNKPPLMKGLIENQLRTAYRSKPILPPNCKEYYQGIAVCEPDNFCKLIKNPVNYVVKKTFGYAKRETNYKRRK